MDGEAPASMDGLAAVLNSTIPGRAVSIDPTTAVKRQKAFSKRLEQGAVDQALASSGLE